MAVWGNQRDIMVNILKGRKTAGKGREGTEADPRVVKIHNCGDFLAAFLEKMGLTKAAGAYMIL